MRSVCLVLEETSEEKKDRSDETTQGRADTHAKMFEYFNKINLEL